jgi:3-oxoadipate enol-lactonase
MTRDASRDARARPPVLILTGHGLTAAVALRSVAELEGHFDVITEPAGVADAAHALALLDAAGIDEAHIFGLSFGATVAQQLAIEHPDRVKTLVLGSSTAGGERYVAPDAAVRDFLRRLANLPAEEGMWASVPYLYSATTFRNSARLIGEDIAQRLRRSLDPGSYRQQHKVARAHDTGARLSQITAPTLVLHAEEDRILPLENGRRLADAIPNAQFISLRAAGHAFLTDVPAANRELVSFLLEHSRRRPRSTAASRTGRATRA